MIIIFYAQDFDIHEIAWLFAKMTVLNSFLPQLFLDFFYFFISNKFHQIYPFIQPTKQYIFLHNILVSL